MSKNKTLQIVLMLVILILGCVIFDTVKAQTYNDYNNINANIQSFNLSYADARDSKTIFCIDRGTWFPKGNYKYSSGNLNDDKIYYFSNDENESYIYHYVNGSRTNLSTNKGYNSAAWAYLFAKNQPNQDVDGQMPTMKNNPLQRALWQAINDNFDDYQPGSNFEGWIGKADRWTRSSAHPLLKEAYNYSQIKDSVTHDAYSKMKINGDSAIESTVKGTKIMGPFTITTSYSGGYKFLINGDEIVAGITGIYANGTNINNKICDSNGNSKTIKQVNEELSFYIKDSSSSLTNLEIQYKYIDSVEAKIVRIGSGKVSVPTPDTDYHCFWHEDALTFKGDNDLKEYLDKHSIFSSSGVQKYFDISNYVTNPNEFSDYPYYYLGMIQTNIVSDRIVVEKKVKGILVLNYSSLDNNDLIFDKFFNNSVEICYPNKFNAQTAVMKIEMIYLIKSVISGQNGGTNQNYTYDVINLEVESCGICQFKDRIKQDPKPIQTLAYITSKFNDGTDSIYWTNNQEKTYSIKLQKVGSNNAPLNNAKFDIEISNVKSVTLDGNGTKQADNNKCTYSDVLICKNGKPRQLEMVVKEKSNDVIITLKETSAPSGNYEIIPDTITVTIKPDGRVIYAPDDNEIVSYKTSNKTLIIKNKSTEKTKVNLNLSKVDYDTEDLLEGATFSGTISNVKAFKYNRYKC